MIVKISDDKEIYKKAAEILNNNGIIAIPTDTIYGFAVDGTRYEPIKRLKDLKKREEKPFTYFIPRRLLQDYVVITKKKIIDCFVPGPITVILKKNPDGKLGSDEEKIGVRIPDYDFVINFLDYYNKPIAVTSANISGAPALLNPFEIAEKFSEIELIIDAGTLSGKPSTVIDLTTPIPVVKRKGAIPILEIEKIYGRRIKLDPSLKFNLLFVCSGNSCRSPMAQGIIKTMLDTRYVEVKSAGTAAMDGLPASENARAIVKEFGGDISDHRTRYLTEELIDEADLILVMEFKHYETVLEISPGSAIKTFLLKEYKRRTKYNEVSDPVGRDLSTYRDTALEMFPSLRFVAEDIKRRLIQ
jgi:tRNA threonylcarbamoyl adenosine modification protein (Sua5/YciO/YrdC/YwlC family)|uniref:L-threonylcarbamoyladenylate synthase n=1 Tax=candidate division WOR-3 bacterium TaxID=2052148 RepID=A0A7C6AFT9_UNCW3